MLYLTLMLTLFSTLIPEKKSAVSESPKMNVYFLSGLGADKRVFDKLKLDDRYDVHYIEWISPKRKEPLHDYAQRLIAQMDTTKPFQLVGLSFGGIVASEIAEIVRPEQIILISSTPTNIPVSKFNRGLIKFFLASPFAAPILKSTNSYTYRYFGADTPELKTLLKQILHDTDSKFLKWALIRMSEWKHPDKAENLYHIHGSEDRLIPLKIVKPDIIIEGGGHLMVYKQHEEISKILNQQLAKKFK
ncbi:alpha/beta fold hydrolase [Dyadobacter sp. CY356]|uniref:alpha/beta fold hydrolase n=1 Tax=Dyadobacter sp. CY356 TaxID=2906442 RepID=UPI001F3A6165|nr:alpha/beta hydrolase [Dyadobacter sp. CY356]MCF0056815.1 alpha/beta hydrolase [Dyadobacter sp. CY356]